MRTVHLSERTVATITDVPRKMRTFVPGHLGRYRGFQEAAGPQESCGSHLKTFYEGPNDIHTVGRNASDTQPAKFIVVLVKDKSTPVFEAIDPTTASLSALPDQHSGEHQ